MSTQLKTDGPTPAGGAYMITFFRDAEGNPVDEQDAVAAEILEYDDKGEVIFRTYGRFD